MPEEPFPKAKEHPLRAGGTHTRVVSHAQGYAELAVTSNFTFLTGASHPDELVARAAELGYAAIAITDTHSLAGMVRAHVAAKQAGLPLVVGARIVLQEPVACSVLLHVMHRDGYANLCRLLTVGKRRAPKGECHLSLHDVCAHEQGLLATVVPPVTLDETCVEVLRGLQRVFDDDRLSLAMSRAYQATDAARIEQIAAMSRLTGVPIVATNDVHYHTPDRRALQDVLTCIREGCTIDEAGYRLHANAERYLKPADEMARLFAAYPDAIARTVTMAKRCAGFSLDQLRYEYPDEVVPAGTTPMSHLRALTFAGAARRYPEGVPASVHAQLEHELRLIDELRYAPYFLTVHDLVEFANQRGILCQGRGAAANSAVCFCLGVTAVDPARVRMLFERFISKERDEPPDIDIDFEHERREEVIQYIYKKYGRDRAALTAEVISYRGRSAIREVGKVMGLSRDCVDRLAKDLTWWEDKPATPRRMRELGLNPNDSHLSRVVTLAKELMGFPRHLGQHVGGFVITRGPLCESVPIENAAMPDRTIIEWDKDDIEALGMLKVDCLGLGMLTCIRKAITLINQHALTAPNQPLPLELATIPPEDPATYDMICDADTIGVFQIESRAQMSMLPRLKPRCYYDLVIEVAIVRPGPIQGKMVHPYLKRRDGIEPTVYASPEIERVLSRTLGVPLFQEQAMSLAVVAAGFTPGEADQLRRAMAAWKRSGSAILKFEKKLIDGMLARGHSIEFARGVFQQISGFSGYGFPESHAASFALLVYTSCWLKKHHPAAFACALLNSQPMGFYQPSQIVQDAARHGVCVRPVDINHSDWDCTLEATPDGPALRLGMRLAQGMRADIAQRIARERTEHGAYRSLDNLRRRVHVPVSALRTLAQADAFASLALSRQQALWNMRRMSDVEAPLFEQADRQLGRDVDSVADPLPAIHPASQVTADYVATGLSLKSHPLRFMRDMLVAKRVIENVALQDAARTPTGMRVTVAGMVLVRQRPGTASGIVFITIEDETGVANLIVRPEIYERYRRAARHAGIILCTGTVERAGKVVHIKAKSIRSADGSDETLIPSRDFH
ncbi:MAG TPA: error-prone DNA polymerase [Phycisphaerales bacterium]|nr:error-prone DNA polymerase [Phycisphaerales bacterium]